MNDLCDLDFSLKQETLYHNLMFVYQHQNKNNVIGVPKDLVEEILTLLEKEIRNWEGPGSR